MIKGTRTSGMAAEARPSYALKSPSVLMGHRAQAARELVNDSMDDGDYAAALAAAKESY
jgi:hypothetical protein